MDDRNYKYNIQKQERVASQKHRYFATNYEKILHKRLCSTELSSLENSLLVLVSILPNMSQVDLSKKLFISAAAVGVNLRKLEAKGYIKRISREHDPRANEITLTEKGHSCAELGHEIFHKIDKSLFEGFSTEEMSIFLDFIDRLCVNSDQILEDHQ